MPERGLPTIMTTSSGLLVEYTKSSIRQNKDLIKSVIIDHTRYVNKRSFNRKEISGLIKVKYDSFKTFLHNGNGALTNSVKIKIGAIINKIMPSVVMDNRFS